MLLYTIAITTKSTIATTTTIITTTIVTLNISHSTRTSSD